MAKIYKLVLFVSIFILAPFYVYGAELSVTPSSATYEVGDTVTLQVMVTSTTQLNAVSASILFPKNIFSIDSVSKSSSILNFWTTEPSIIRSTNTVSFEGVSLGGFQGTTGNVVTIRLKALSAGTGSISFQSGQILANDGQGTDITGGLTGATYTIKEAKEKPKTKVNVPVVEEPVVKEEAPQSIKAPEISLGSKYGEPAIVGYSDYPKSQVLLTFISGTGAKIFISGIADPNGDFTMLVPSSLKHGSYTVSAVTILLNGKNSPESNIIEVNYGNFLSDIGWEGYSLLAILLIIIIYQFTKISKSSPAHVSKKVKQDVNVATNTVKKTFSNIRSDLKSKKMSDLRSDIDDAEDKITKDIKDIESI